MSGAITTRRDGRPRSISTRISTAAPTSRSTTSTACSSAAKPIGISTTRSISSRTSTRRPASASGTTIDLDYDGSADLLDPVSGRPARILEARVRPHRGDDVARPRVSPRVRRVGSGARTTDWRRSSIRFARDSAIRAARVATDRSLRRRPLHVGRSAGRRAPTPYRRPPWPSRCVERRVAFDSLADLHSTSPRGPPAS